MQPFVKRATRLAVKLREQYGDDAVAEARHRLSQEAVNGAFKLSAIWLNVWAILEDKSLF